MTTTALHRAARAGDTARTAELIAQGADPNAADENGRTPLHHAAAGADTATIRALIELGADVNARDKFYRTPLHRAAAPSAFRRHPPRPAITALLEHTADPNAIDVDGTTPLHCAALRADAASITQIITAGADPNQPDHLLADTPLHAAASSGAQPDILITLIEQGAEVNCHNRQTRTPLHMALSEFHTLNPEVITALLEHGADVGARDQEGRTPLHELASAAASAPRRDGILAQPDCQLLHRLVTTLLEAGADPAARDIFGDRPQEIARDSGKEVGRVFEACIGPAPATPPPAPSATPPGNVQDRLFNSTAAMAAASARNELDNTPGM